MSQELRDVCAWVLAFALVALVAAGVAIGLLASIAAALLRLG